MSTAAWEIAQENEALVDKFLKQYLWGDGIDFKSARKPISAPGWVFDSEQGVDVIELVADLRSVGLLALEKAVRKRKPSKGELSTIAAPIIARTWQREVEHYRRDGRHIDAEGQPLVPVDHTYGGRKGPKGSLGIGDAILRLGASDDSDASTSDAKTVRPEALTGSGNGEMGEVPSSAFEPSPQSPAIRRGDSLASGLTEAEAATRRLALNPKEFVSHLQTSTKPSPELLAEAIAYIKHGPYWEQWAFYEARRLLGKWARSCKELTPKQRQLGDNLRKWTERELKELKRRTN